MLFHPRNGKKIAKMMDYLKLPLLQQGDIQDDTFLRSRYSEEEISVIGTGSNGSKVLSVKRKEGEKIAVRVIEDSSQETIRDYAQELKLVTVLKDNPNVLQHINYLMNSINLKNGTIAYQILIEMPLASTNLEFLLKSNGSLPEDEINDILRQVASGLKYAHEKNEPHLGLKPENILFKEGILLISDWGTSLKFKRSNQTIVSLESAFNPYNAPEIGVFNYERNLEF